ncbi:MULTISPECIES: tetratricopeptide repeat protein [unclassified Xanthobacter]|uniref:tetratricopeptide repeat protein n=1 Tax=unclassified Xanthobacter TaxID=2623496 RepID=UPI001EDF3039|nr:MULTISPECIES: tetratricopeptide repeat protein [unclassified Xanthobacter]
MTDIFHEIQEDLRRERLRKLWDRFGALIIAAVVLVIVAAGAWSGYRYWRTQQAIAAGAEFQQAVTLADAGKFAEAEAAFETIAKTGPEGYRAIAAFRAAGAAAARDPAAGVAAFDAIAANRSVEPLLRDMAQLRAGMILLDTADLGEVKKRVGDLAAGTGALRNSAREVLALAQLKAGDSAAAYKTATDITEDAGSAPGVRSRADLIRRITAEAAAPAAPATAPATTGGTASKDAAPEDGASKAAAPATAPAAPASPMPAATTPAATMPAAPPAAQ